MNEKSPAELIAEIAKQPPTTSKIAPHAMALAAGFKAFWMIALTLTAAGALIYGLYNAVLLALMLHWYALCIPAVILIWWGIGRFLLVKGYWKESEF